jgi:cysteine desulfurase
VREAVDHAANLAHTAKLEFIPCPSVLYFDHNATSPLCAEARAAWLQATEEFIGNASSPHRLGRRAEVALDRARETLAAGLGCAPREIVWTSGATESVNTAVQHVSCAAGDALLSPLEHPCVLQAAHRWFGERVRFIPLLPGGALDLGALEDSLRQKRPAFVAVMAANNETGALQPWREVRALCGTYEVPLLCDAAQWIGKLPARGLGECDFVSGCAHKFGGPLGVGFLKVRGTLKPLIVGGGQEEGRRAGTENVPGVLGMLAAFEARESSLAAGLHERRGWREEFIREMLSEFPDAQLVAPQFDTLWNTVSMVMPDVDCRQRWVVKLDKLGFAVSTGSACASGKEKPSHVLTALSYSPALAARVLRFSSGWQTTREDWQSLLTGISEAFAQMQAEQVIAQL